MSKKSDKPVREKKQVLKRYECMLILVNTLKEEPRQKLLDKIVAMTGDASTKVDKWGLKKFATEINHKKDGYYYLLNFKCLPEAPRKMTDLMNITDGVVRFMFVCLDDVKKKKTKTKPKKETPKLTK